ncbi:uncharacterized protein [Montipora capricornis]|uniref:uncharacterized protein n=1 Tax=Montipora capricornis TaxID=246305 RepID=UPI0035F1B4B5
MECKLSFTIAVIALLGSAVKINARFVTISSKLRSDSDLDNLIKVYLSQGNHQSGQLRVRCNGILTRDRQARFKILPVPNKQSGMKCIQFLTNNEEYALKAISDGSQWKLVFERQECSSAYGPFLFNETKRGGDYSWEASGVGMYLSCPADDQAMLSLITVQDASEDTRIKFSYSFIRNRRTRNHH